MHAVVHAPCSKFQVASTMPAVVLLHAWPGYVYSPLYRPSAVYEPALPHVHVLKAGRPQPAVHEGLQLLLQTVFEDTVQAAITVHPVVQEEHPVEAADAEYVVPAAHDRQAATDTCPVPALYVPATHAVHADVPAVTAE